MTTEVEWINRGDSAIINGWYFHFKDMCAFRGSGAKLERRELIEKYIDSHILSWYRFEDRWLDIPGVRRLAGHAGQPGDPEEWYAFFTPPEERFNQIVQEAYETYLFETAIRNNESS